MTILKSKQAFVLLSTLIVSMQSTGASLQESIRYAIINNPKTESISLRMQAMQERQKALKASLLPSLNISSSISESRYKSGQETTTYRSYGTGISTGVNLYNGGSDIADIKAGEARLKATDALYNSSNSFIQNSKAGLANSVFRSYISLSRNIEQKKFFENRLLRLEFLKKAKPTSEQLNLIQQQIKSTETTLVNVNYNISEDLRDYRYFTTQNPPTLDQVQNFNAIIQSLTIPESTDEAYQVALEKSPEVKVAEYDLQAAQYYRESEKGRLFRPRADLQIGVNNSRSGVPGESSSDSTSTYIGVSISYSIGAGSVYRNSASAKDLAIAETEKISALDELKYSLDSIYPNLYNQKQVNQLNEENLISVEISLDEINKKIEAGQKVDIKATLDLLDVRTGYWFSALSTKENIAGFHFKIQRTVGLLFDNLKIPPHDQSYLK